jgi:hypothetical protein
MLMNSKDSSNKFYILHYGEDSLQSSFTESTSSVYSEISTNKNRFEKNSEFMFLYVHMSTYCDVLG